MTGVLVKTGHVDTGTEGQRCEDTQGEDGYQQAEERGLGRSFPPGPQKQP